MNPIQEKAVRDPGQLTADMLGQMRKFLVTQQGGSSKEDIEAICMSYLTSVLLPSRPTMSLRSSGELRNLGTAMDYLLQGNVVAGLDVLSQRFKTVEASETEGWAMARHLQLVSDTGVSSLPRREREMIAKQEKDDLKLKALMKGKG